MRRLLGMKVTTVRWSDSGARVVGPSQAVAVACSSLDWDHSPHLNSLGMSQHFHQTSFQ